MSILSFNFHTDFMKQKSKYKVVFKNQGPDKRRELQNNLQFLLLLKIIHLNDGYKTFLYFLFLIIFVFVFCFCMILFFVGFFYLLIIFFHYLLFIIYFALFTLVYFRFFDLFFYYNVMLLLLIYLL